MAGKLTLDDIRPFLQNPKRRGTEIVAACPVCEAGNPKGHHLYIKADTGDFVATCHHGCTFAEILKAYRDLGAVHADDATPTVIENIDYTYTNPDGATAYVKHRQKLSNGEKRFSFRHKSKGQTIYKKPEHANSLYHLDELASASTETPLYIVEGEKCADAMKAHGFLSTTSDTGGGNVKLTATDKEILQRFKTVYLIPDNDDVGENYAKSWPIPVEVIPMTDLWPKCPSKGDVADFFARGGEADTIRHYQPLNRAFFQGLDLYGCMDLQLLARIADITDPVRQNVVLTLAKTRIKELRSSVRDFMTTYQSIAEQRRAAARPAATAAKTTDFPQQPLKLDLPKGYSVKGNAIFKKYADSKQNERFELVSRVPILPTQILANVDDDTERLEVSCYTYHRWKTITAKRSIWANQNKIIELADRGLDVDSSIGKRMSQFIAEIVALNREKIPLQKSVSHLGWTGPNGSIFVPYSSEITFDSTDEYRDYASAVTDSKGTLQEWAAGMAPLRASVPVRLMLDAAFASIILEKIPVLPFIVHLWGPTGCGKSVTLRLAASIWGNPADGKLTRTMNMTANSLMMTVAMLRNLPFFGDELQTIKTRDFNYDKLIMQLTEGINRGRLRSDSSLHPTKSWKNLFLFTGEEPITVHNSGGGAKNRVIEIEADGQLIADGQQATEFALTHYGLAGKEFVEKLPNYLDEIKQGYRTWRNTLKEATAGTDKQIMAMAAILATDDVVRKLYWPAETALRSAEVAPFIKTAPDVSTALRAWKYIQNAIDIYQKNFIKDEEGIPDPDSVHSTTIWGRFFGDSVFINRNALDKLLNEKCFSFDAIKKEWADAGYLIKYKNKYATHRSIVGNSGYYCQLSLYSPNPSEKDN